MLNKSKQLLQTATDWTFEVVGEVVYQILLLQGKVLKHLFKLTWKMLKFTAWSLTQKNFWKGLSLSIPTTAFCVLLAMTLSYFRPYTGLYFGYENRILSDREKMLLEQVKEYEKRKKEFDFLESLRSGNKEAVRTYIERKFGEASKTALAVFTAESGLTCNRYQNWLNSDKSVDHGVAQINSVHLWRVNGDKNKLLDCKTNIDVAYQIYKEQGFKPWVAYQNGAYIKFLSSL